MDLFATAYSCKDCTTCEYFKTSCDGVIESCPLSCFTSSELQHQGRLHCTAPASWLMQFFNGFFVPSPDEIASVNTLGSIADTLPAWMLEGRRRGVDLEFIHDPPFEQEHFVAKSEQYLLNGHLRSDEAKYIHNEIGLSQRTKLILSFSYRDDELNDLWRVFNDKILINQLKRVDHLGILSPNFGPALDHSRYEHIYNMNRDIYMWYEFMKAGLCAIPPVFIVDSQDRNRWKEYIGKSNIPYLYITLTKLNSEREYIEEIKNVFKVINSDTKVIMTGLSDLNIIIRILTEYGKENFTVVVSGPYERALITREIIVKKGVFYLSQKVDWSDYDIIAHNINVYREALS